MDKLNIALANRPPIPSSEKDCGCGSSNDVKPIKPNNPSASLDTNRSGNIPIITGYSESKDRSIPVLLKTNENNDYMVVESDMEYEKNDKLITDLPKVTRAGDIGSTTRNSNTFSGYKIDFASQIYVGSLTILGLFVFYRLIQKTR